jgi:hypothetical protein
MWYTKLTEMEEHILAVHDSLIRLEEGQGSLMRRIDRDILPRIDKINGSVAAVTQEQNRLKVELAEHPIKCPVSIQFQGLAAEIMRGDHPPSKEALNRVKEIDERVVALETSDAKRSGSQNTSLWWWDNILKPVLFFLVGGLIALLLKFGATAKIP